VALTSLACLAAGWALGWAELSIVGIGGALALVAGRLVYLRPIRLEVSRSIAPTRVTRGEQAVGVVTVVNRSRLLAAAMIATDMIGVESAVVHLPALRPGASHTVTYRLPTAQRGIVSVGPLRVVADDPFGLFRSVRSYGLLATLTVLPHTVDLEPAAAGRAATIDGPMTERAERGTATFHSLRGYTTGDDLRYIHWRATAHTGALMVRNMVDSGHPRSTIILDTRPAAYAHDDDFETAVDVAASIAVSSARRGSSVALFTAAGALTVPTTGVTATGPLLDQLTVVERAAGDLDAIIGAVRPGPTSGSLVLVTGLSTVDSLGRLGSASQLFDRTIVIRILGAAAPSGPAVRRIAMTVLDAIDLPAAALAWRREVVR
jgi:uncharacterized protein (DUF58 family)